MGTYLQRGRLFSLYPYVEYTLQDVLLSSEGTSTAGAGVGCALPRKHALRLTAQLLEAVAHCHARGVMHRNLKPKHILLCLRGPSASASSASCYEVPRPLDCAATPRHKGGTGGGGSAEEEGWNLDGAVLLLADFALMRAIPKPLKTLTTEVSVSKVCQYFERTVLRCVQSVNTF